MSRRLNPCRLCSGRTRHDDRRCSACRSFQSFQGAAVWLVPSIANPAAPTLAELSAGIRLPVWHGTDCGCATCAADRVPGRYA